MYAMGKKAGAFLLLGLIISSANLLAGVAATCPAVYVFGDSTVDVGNNNFLPADASKANFLPYGIDFPGRIPTGRFTNGFTTLDFIAQAAGLVYSPPSFLSIRNENQAARGVNFASAGSGILDTTGRDVITMARQIKDFKGVAVKLTARRGHKYAAALLGKSLFYINVGSNDLFALSAAIDLGNSTQKDEAIALVIDKFKGQLKTLYKLGARKFAVQGTAALGCVPAVRVGVPTGDCDPGLNDIAVRFKNVTKVLLGALSVSLKGFKYSFADWYRISEQIIANPRKYGFTEVKAACCGSGRLNAEGLCLPNTTYCGDRSRYFFWDWVHPSQVSYRLVARWSLSGRPLLVSPANIYSLLKS